MAVEGGQAIYTRCTIPDYEFALFFSDNVDGDDEKSIRAAWKYGGRRKEAVKMVGAQLLRDFNEEEVLEHVTIREDMGECDGFYFEQHSEKMFVPLSFDKEWLIDWYLEQHKGSRF